MKSDGKQLEGLVSFVEKTLLPQGFDVKTNERVYNDEGIQIAEFDIEIRGKVGSTHIAWLIECRDRPGQGPAPGSWIEQLVGRRMRFGFNKVTAVSTTGFAPGATDFAQVQGIELREVKSLDPDEFSEWLVMRHWRFLEHVTRLDDTEILINEGEREKQAALSEAILSYAGNDKILRSSKTGEMVSPAVAFLGAVSEAGTLFEGLEPNGPGRTIKLRVHYTNEADHLVVDTALGPVRVEAIVFCGELSVRERLIPLTVTAEYRRTETGEPISQVASFEPHCIDGKMFSLELHRIPESGETHVILRKLPDNA